MTGYVLNPDQRVAKIREQNKRVTHSGADTERRNYLAGNKGGSTGEIALVLDFGIVQQYVIEREIPGAGRLSEIQIRELALRSLEKLRSMGPQIQWLHSYVTEDKVYCVYLAPDEETIREHAHRVGIPADRISAVRHLIDPALLN